MGWFWRKEKGHFHAIWCEERGLFQNVDREAFEILQDFQSYQISLKGYFVIRKNHLIMDSYSNCGGLYGKEE